MKNTFKKITASIMAVASLAISATGVVASATDVTTSVTPEIIERYSGPTGYVKFGDNAEAGIYCDSSQVNASTTRSSTTYKLCAEIKEVYTGSVYSPTAATSYNSTGAYLNTKGSNITGVKTNHYYNETSNSSKVSTELTRYC